MTFLSSSNGPQQVNKDELFQKLQQTVLETAHDDCSKARDTIRSRLAELYPDNYANVFVWKPSDICFTKVNNIVATALFQTSEDSSYGHDVLVILN